MIFNKNFLKFIVLCFILLLWQYVFLVLTCVLHNDSKIIAIINSDMMTNKTV